MRSSAFSLDSRKKISPRGEIALTARSMRFLRRVCEVVIVFDFKKQNSDFNYINSVFLHIIREYYY